MLSWKPQGGWLVLPTVNWTCAVATRLWDGPENATAGAYCSGPQSTSATACLRQMAATVWNCAGDTCLSGTHNICRLEHAFIRSTPRRSQRMHFQYEWCTGSGVEQSASVMVARGNGGQWSTKAFHHVLKALATFVSSILNPVNLCTRTGRWSMVQKLVVLVVPLV